jgi:hypothetical protein
MQFCFVSTRRGSQFMTELLAAIADAMTADGHSAEVVLDAFPERGDECVYVVVPHEFDAWGDPQGFPDAHQRARTIALCTENLGTAWFEATYRLVPQYAAAVSINRSSAAELRRRGIRCEHLQLGYVPSWDTWHRDESARREIDVLYLGAADPRRDPLLAGLGKDLARRHCQLLVPPLEPRTGPRPDFLTGTDKYHRLRSARVLMNLHRTTSAALEWMRFIEAICNGCVVVSEPSLDGEPLVAGEHYVQASADRIGQVIDELLDEPERLRVMRERAYDFVRDALPMSSDAKRLVELAGELVCRRPAQASSRDAADSPIELHRAAGQSDSPARPLGRTRQDEVGPVVLLRPTGPQAESSAIRRAWQPTRGLTRRVFALRAQADFQSPRFELATPRVSVISVVGRGGEAMAAEALAGLSATIDPQIEVLTTGDSASRTRLKQFSSEHPTLAFAFLRETAGEGVGASLNRLVERARGNYVFALDATGGVFPVTLARLTTTLEDDPDAHFAYSMIGIFDEDRPAGLRSSLPWEPTRLQREDWIDAMALVRRDRLLALGCFATDPRLAGWEAFDLWCRCADAGGYGLHIPQVLAWHRHSAQSVAVVRPAPQGPLRGVLQERYPHVFRPS